MLINIWRKWRKILRRSENSTNPVYCILLICVIILQCYLLYSHTCDTKPYTEKVSAMSQRELMSMEEVRPVYNLSQLEQKEDTQTPMTIISDCGYWCTVDKQQSLYFKTPIRDKGFLTIGVPTVRRTKGTYLMETISSLISALNDTEKNEVIILVFLADFNQTDKDALAVELKSKFEIYINSGLLQVIQAPETFYPHKEVKRLTYGRNKEYVKWRSKQNYDFAYMFKYAKNISAYYMQIEDDVSTRPQFLSFLKRFIKKQEDYWICLEFSELGFIGKLYRTEHLERLATLFMMFYSEQPVDVTYLFFNNLMVQFGRRIQIPTLFQHNGYYSSLPGKLQQLKDRYFVNLTKAYKGDNPPADVFTTMSVYMTFVPKLAYESTQGYFWSHGSQKSGDTFTIIFQSPQRLKRVVVTTGSLSFPNDRIHEGKLEGSLTFVNNSKTLECTNDIQIGTFKNGVVENATLLQTLSFKLMCLRITVTKDMVNWIIIKEIAVFTV